MILYYCKNIDNGTIFVAEKLSNGLLRYPESYSFAYLIKVDLIEYQLEELKEYGWTGYDILSSY